MPHHRIDGRAQRGRAGEEATLRAYERRGFRALARNWRCPLGELDLVVEREDLLVFCEVKTRSGSAFGAGYEAVTTAKRRKLRHLADVFMLSERPRHGRLRFDVASVSLGPRAPTSRSSRTPSDKAMSLAPAIVARPCTAGSSGSPSSVFVATRSPSRCISGAVCRRSR